jgi:putative effector of murein hydrolase
MLLAHIDSDAQNILWLIYVISTVATIVPLYSAFRTPLPKHLVVVVSGLAGSWGAFLTYACIHDSLGWDINWLFAISPVFGGIVSLWRCYRPSRPTA